MMKTDSDKPETVAEAKSEATLAAPPVSAYLVDCNPHGKELVESKTISEALANNRIVSVSKEEDGRFCVQEGCDDYFRGYLTREQLLAWAEELKSLAGMPNDAGERIAAD